MAWERRKSGPKIAKNQPPPLFPFSFFPRQPSAALSTSPQLPSPARIPTNPAYTPPRTPAPPQEASTTTKQPPRLSLSSPSGLSPLQTSSSCAVATPAAKLSINAATSLSTSTTTGPHRLRWFSIPALHQPPLLLTAAVAACRIHSASSDQNN